MRDPSHASIMTPEGLMPAKVTLDSEPERKASLVPGGGELGRLIRSHAWAHHPLGPIEQWPQSLRTAVSMMLESHFAMVVAWGPEFRFLYNDRYRPVLGATKHPGAIGTPAREIFPEAWDFIGPLFERTRKGEAVALDDVLIPLNRNGYLEDCWFDLSYSPIRDESGGVGGMLAVVAETTERVEGERRLGTLRDLLRAAGEAQTRAGACSTAVSILKQNPVDVPFALVYLASEDGQAAELVAATGLPEGSELAAQRIDLSGAEPERGWPLQRAMLSRGLERVSDLKRRFRHVPQGPYPQSPHTAVICPLVKPTSRAPIGYLVTGVNARRALDERYETFWNLAADHVLSAVSNASAFEEAKARAEALAAIDRAKTAFFSNVSHEFRTPLTLMLGPLEEALADAEQPLPQRQRERALLVQKSSLRLQKLVNALLDFSRIEAGRADVSFAPVDLGTLTRELASNFRSVIESAGMTFTVDCQPLAEPVWVDAAAWEKVVFNLLSNAFKYTLEGGVTLRLRQAAGHVELGVTDTGTGIPASELKHVFDRFYRVPNARGRSHEGTGLGLALVQELVTQHGGTVAVESELGRGTTFTVRLKAGSEHLPKERLRAGARPPAPATARAFLEEAADWTRPVPVPSASPGHQGARILVADDNADMREYLQHLLEPSWHVELVKNGAQALEAALHRPPDLVLSDVMMPELDGLALLRALRSDARTRTIPVVLLSARAGEDATLSGLDAGADDYLVKPFSANELITRIRTQLDLQAARREALDAEHAYAEQVKLLLDEARRATRSREETLAVVSHDLRSPLAAIATAAELVVRRAGDKADAVQRHVEAIQRQVARMKRLIDDLLDLAAIDSGELKVEAAPHAPVQLVREAREAFQAQFAERRVGLNLQVEPSLPELLCDKGRVLQVFSNLLSNALRFSPEGSFVTLAARRTDGGGVLFSVKDQGPGIPADVRPRLFERYSKGRAARGDSHGLGLSIARGIVEAHGGAIDVDTAAGAGTTFWFRLPQSPQQGAKPKPVAPTISDPSSAVREEFLSLASHELRTPLTALQLELEGTRRVLKRIEPSAAVSSAQTRVQSSLGQAQRLASTVESVLDAVQIDNGDFRLDLEGCDLAQVVTDAARRVTADAEDLGASLRLRGFKPCPGRWDAKRMERAVMHVLANAVKHAPGAPVELSLLTTDKTVEIEVKDQGPGIEPSDLKRIFGRFERARPKAYGGLGLGLFVTRHIIEAHGGTVQVESVLGAGTRFVLRMPRAGVPQG